jgi:hypothetical protein
MNQFKKIIIILGVAGLLILMVGAFEFLISWSPWLLLTPIILMLAAIPIYKMTRWIALRRKGFFISRTRKQQVIYEERHGKKVETIPLETVNFGPGENHIVIPTRQTWDNQAPSWAKNRRDEIFNRVVEEWPKDWVEFPEDWNG